MWSLLANLFRKKKTPLLTEIRVTKHPWGEAWEIPISPDVLKKSAAEESADPPKFPELK